MYYVINPPIFQAEVMVTNSGCALNAALKPIVSLNWHVLVIMVFIQQRTVYVINAGGGQGTAVSVNQREAKSLPAVTGNQKISITTGGVGPNSSSRQS